MRRLEQRQRLLQRQRRPGVTAIGVHHQYLAAVLGIGTVEVGAERIVQGREAVGLALPNPLDQPCEVALRISRDAHLRVEIHEGDVLGRRQHVQELDGGALRELHVGLHAAARIEHQTQVHRRAGIAVAVRKVLDRLQLAVFDDLEVILREAGNQVPLLVGNGGGKSRQIDAAAEDGLGLEKYRITNDE